MRFFFIFIFFSLSGFLYAADNSFPSSLDLVPQDYEGPIFKLSQDYPSVIPNEPKPWEEIDFKTQGDKYMGTLRDYIFEGMIEADWRPENNQKNQWFHMPWMHIGKHPREFIHGLTRERDLKEKELGTQHIENAQNWAIGFYNSYAGYTIGKVWENHEAPDLSMAQFEVGSVILKLLFTDANATQIPQFEGSVVWKANINSTIDENSPKDIRDIHLFQIDVAVRDARANDTTGWVFGTFVYNKDLPGDNPWLKMVPVGLQWGNDPGVTPDDIYKGITLKETWISPQAPEYSKKRLGWAGRLNGPADNQQSSCLSCHSTAQWPRNSDMVAKGTDKEKLQWFRNIKFNESFDSGSTTTDYSLQLTLSIENFLNSQKN